MDRRGGTLVESMIAFSIFAMTAMAAYPIFVTAKKQTKFGDTRQLCQNVVRAKLDEYRLGRETTISDAANATGDYNGLPGIAANAQLNNLSVSTRSDTTVQNQATGKLVSGGFLYAKVRYNRFFPYSCNDSSKALLFAALPAAQVPVLGMRECVGSNAAWKDVAGAAPVNCLALQEDQKVDLLLPGFKLYVKLELSSPWQIAPNATGVTTIAGGTAAQNAQFSNTCPDFGSWVAASHPTQGSLYDFDGAGDGIKVTVTGVIDTASKSAAINNVGGIQGALDPLRLTCSASAVVKPPSDVVRYYLSPDGRIYSVHGAGQNGNQSGGWAFQSIYGQTGSDTDRASGVVSFAVHPRNLSVWVLRRGSLTRYSNCGGVPVDCDSGGTGITDGVAGAAAMPATAAIPSIQEFPVLPSISMVAIDFRSGAVYGMTGDKSDVLSITLNNGKPLATCLTCDQLNPPTLAYNSVAANVFPKPIPNVLRLTGFFVSPEGDEAFVSDLTATNALGGLSYSAAIYRALDANMINPVARLPVDAVSFSK